MGRTPISVPMRRYSIVPLGQISMHLVPSISVSPLARDSLVMEKVFACFHTHLAIHTHTPIDPYPEGTQATNDGVDRRERVDRSAIKSLRKGTFIARMIIVF